MNTERLIIEKLEAPEGKIYTQASKDVSDRVYATTIYLGNQDTITNWELIDTKDIPEQEPYIVDYNTYNTATPTIGN